MSWVVRVARGVAIAVSVADGAGKVGWTGVVAVRVGCTSGARVGVFVAGGAFVAAAVVSCGVGVLVAGCTRGCLVGVRVACAVAVGFGRAGRRVAVGRAGEAVAVGREVCVGRGVAVGRGVRVGCGVGVGAGGALAPKPQPDRESTATNSAAAADARRTRFLITAWRSGRSGRCRFG